MVGMICSAFVAIILGVQPVCGEAIFSSTLEPALRGDSRIIARAVFDAYLEKVAKINTPPLDRPSRIEEIKKQQAQETRADTLFDSFLDSLAVLGDSPSLKTGIMSVRRSVLLDARQANNPWPNALWYDISETVQINSQFTNAVDSFLLQHVDNDRVDRYTAIIAKLEGDQETCAKAEWRTMQRWAIFNNLVEQFENESTLEYRFPTIPHRKFVDSLYLQITDTIKDEKTIDIIRGQMTIYSTLHNKQKHALIELIKSARINEGIDPLSSGCGSVGNTKNIILQRTAEMHELNAATMQSMSQVLTPEQRQQLEFVE